ncbi:SDR family oxidoreductase [Pleurocapsa sp. PCC 7319]|uniref:SDR family NAD(P)-dependent oxidoreductase n=1 Tax=Pleurocapsa sp. PCC 7319 TaxID=118161 RepID=UPI000348AD0A|nr:SDR family oxidoreductase [Pleurocapsa sp. PCC 7319]
MKTALITGASSGIGETFARELASRNMNLILIARSQDKLEQLASELTSKHQIKTEVIVKDLTEPGAGQVVFDRVQAQSLTVDLLINNAGFGDYGAFSDRTLSKQMAMVQLNITVLLELTGLFLPEMQQRGSGGIINISSIAGFQPLPYMSVYAATKAFVLNFSEALWAENKDLGVHVLAVCPGPTESEFFKRADFPDTFANGNGNSMASSEEVVEQALKAMDKKQSTLVTGGISNKLLVNVPRFVPRDFLVTAVEKQFKQSEK